MAGLSTRDTDEEGEEASKTQTGDCTIKADNERLRDPEEEEEEPSLQSATTRHRARLNEQVHRLLQDAITTQARFLDLSRKGLKTIPLELLEIPSLQNLYLEGNQLVSLPENFFDCLPNLQWLDLRSNYLASIPSTYIGRHQHLKNLLLEGNELRTLPLELGLVSSLIGLNIANNPLDFPPQEIIEGGTQNILGFFREMLRAKSQGRALPVSRLDDFSAHGDTMSTDSEDGQGHLYSSFGRGNPMSNMLKSIPTKDSKSAMFASAEDLNLVGPVPQSASLHKPVSYQELRQMQMDRLEKAGVLQPTSKKKPEKKQRKGSKGSRKTIDIYPDAPGPELIEQRYIEERRLSRLKELKEKQDLILQRRKDADKLQKFRDDSKRLQRDKMMEKMRNGGKIDFEEPAKKAPFDVHKDDLRMMSNEERIAQDIKAKHEKIRQRPMSPGTLQRMEDARAERDRELERRIRTHTESMQDRRRKPKGTPQQEMEAAMRELEVAESLQREIEARRKDMEYRFTAFSVDPMALSRQKKPPPDVK